MLSMSIFPKVMVDYKSIKPGFYFMGNEVLDRFSIFGGISANRLWDVDVFLMLEYMKYLAALGREGIRRLSRVAPASDTPVSDLPAEKAPA